MPMHQPTAISPSSSRHSAKSGVDYVYHHPKYYMVGGDLHVLINDSVMFKVHSYFFKRESRNFFDDAPAPTTAEPSPPEIDDRGSSESRAIRIPHVTVEEFEQFLWVFYNPTYDVYDADIYAWFSILKLAHRWDFPVVKDFALRELQRRHSEIPLVRCIRLYQDHEAPSEFLVPLFAELCARPSGPTDEEIAELGYEQACYVWKTRECLRSTKGGGSLPEGMTQKEIYAVVSEVMDLPRYAPESEASKEPSCIQPGAPSEGDATQSDEGAPSKKKGKDKKKGNLP